MTKTQTAAEVKNTTLQIKSEDGKQVYVLKMRYSATLGDVRKCLDGYRAGQQQRQQGEPPHGQGQQPVDELDMGNPSINPSKAEAPGMTRYELRSCFPARVYGDESMTLEAAQLVPSATLYLKKT
jgi:hypothetical protein